MAAPKDCELMKMMQAGDQQALVALYDRYSKLVYSVALRVLQNSASAEDVLQEIFIQLWHSPEQIHVVGETLCGWMIIASRNRSISILRKKSPDQLDDSILASPCDLEKQTEQRLTCETLVSKLCEDQRILLEMAFFKDMTHAEIASATGYPLGTIKSRIRSALAILRSGFVLTPEIRPLPVDPVVPVAIGLSGV
jgi:RNA polymerase sigma-70 factor (ECF subfamily)